MGLFGTLAKVVALPVKLCNLPVSVYEQTAGRPAQETVFDQVAEAIEEVGEDMDQ